MCAIVRGGVTWSLALAIVQMRRRQALVAFLYLTSPKHGVHASLGRVNCRTFLQRTKGEQREVGLISLGKPAPALP